jgi:WD40 repeat protein
MPKTELRRKYDESPENQVGCDVDQRLPDVLTTVVERVGLVTGADGVAVALCDPEGVRCRASKGQAPAVGSRLQPDSVFTRECLETGQPMLCEDAENDSRVQLSIARDLHLRSALAVPIQGEGLVLGVVEVFSSRPSAFDITHVREVQHIAGLLSPVLSRGPAVPGPAPHPTQVEGASFAEDQPTIRQPLVLFPAERWVDSRTTATGVEERSSSKPVTPSIGRSRSWKRLTALEWIAVALTGLGVLLIPFFFFESHPWPRKAPSTKSNPPASGSPRTDEAGVESRKAQAENTVAVRGSKRPDRSVPPEIPSSSETEQGEIHRAPTTPAVATEQIKNQTKSHPSGAESAVARPDLAPSGMGDRSTEIIAGSPMLVIKEARPGAQVFVDDKFAGSVDSDGQAKVSSLTPGQHNLRLSLNGYRDSNQRVDLVAGQTSGVAVKLEPLEPPILAAPGKTTVLTSPMPSLVRSVIPSIPDFALERTLKAHSGWVTAVAFSVDGQRLASGSWDQTVKFWEVSSGQELGIVADKMKEIQALAFSRDGHWLATENSSNTVTLWDAATGREIRKLPCDKPLGVLGDSWVYSIAFSPDGQWLASGVDNKTVRLWDVSTGRAIRDLVAPRRSVIYIAFSLDGRWLASGGDDKTIRIWDASTGQEIRRLSGHKKSIYAVAFSPNGRFLASASADKTVRVWEVPTGREVHTLTGHGSVVTTLAFSPDGRWLASGSWDRTIKIWDVETGHVLQTLAGHNHPIYTVAFDSRGDRLASGSQDGIIKLWQLREAAEPRGLR